MDFKDSPCARCPRQAAMVKALEGIAEFCSSDATELGAIERLISIRNTALNVLSRVGGAS